MSKIKKKLKKIKHLKHIEFEPTKKKIETKTLYKPISTDKQKWFQNLKNNFYNEKS